MEAIKKTNRVAILWIIAWIVVYVLDLAFSLKPELCCEGMHIIGKEYYRLFTGLLLHVNLFHLLGNIIAMFFVGQFLNGKIGNGKLLVFSLITGTIANTLFSAIRPSSYMIGGSPMIFALIGLILILQMKRKDLPRFKVRTQCGSWILGYAIISNFPFFTKDFSTLLIHVLGLVVGFFAAFLIIRKASDD